jgi:hypothetical protein
VKGPLCLSQLDVGRRLEAGALSARGRDRGPQRPRWRDQLGSGRAAGSAVPRRAVPHSAREPGARAPRTPWPARAGPSPALPRPGAGAARGRLPRAPPAHPGLRARGSRPPHPRRQAARRGGTPRAKLRAGLGPSPPPPRCTAAVRAGAAMNSAAERARGPSPPGLSPSPLAGLRGPRGAPSPRPAPAHARPRSHRAAPPAAPHILELAGAPELGGNALLPGRPAAPAASCPRVPAPASRTPRPLPHPGPRLPAAWHNHRHSPWASRVH